MALKSFKIICNFFTHIDIDIGWVSQHSAKNVYAYGSNSGCLAGFELKCHLCIEAGV